MNSTTVEVLIRSSSSSIINAEQSKCIMYSCFSIGFWWLSSRISDQVCRWGCERVRTDRRYHHHWDSTIHIGEQTTWIEAYVSVLVSGVSEWDIAFTLYMNDVVNFLCCT